MRQLLTITAVVATTVVATGAAPAAPPDDFWANLQGLCGQAFEGRLIAAPDGDMQGEKLVMHVRDCGDRRIRIPFVVGEDLSRTWVLTRTGDRIRLQHDHRHRDGSPEDVTLYGGTSPNPGSANAQIFPADDDTVAMLPNGYPNVWMMAVEPGETFTYYVRRQATDRYYHVEFDLSTPVEPPPAPWGWD